jgi:hypothetical protein
MPPLGHHCRKHSIQKLPKRHPLDPVVIPLSSFFSSPPQTTKRTSMREGTREVMVALDEGISSGGAL